MIAFRVLMTTTTMMMMMMMTVIVMMMMLFPQVLLCEILSIARIPVPVLQITSAPSSTKFVNVLALQICNSNTVAFSTQTAG